MFARPSRAPARTPSAPRTKPVAARRGHQSPLHPHGSRAGTGGSQVLIWTFTEPTSSPRRMPQVSSACCPRSPDHDALLFPRPSRKLSGVAGAGCSVLRGARGEVTDAKCKGLRASSRLLQRRRGRRPRPTEFARRPDGRLTVTPATAPGSRLPASGSRQAAAGMRRPRRPKWASPTKVPVELVVLLGSRWEAVRLLARAPWPRTYLVELSESRWELHAPAERRGELLELLWALPDQPAVQFRPASG